MKKYYGYMVYGDNEYVIRFKIDGSLHWKPSEKAFVDKDWYVRSAEDIIYLAACDGNPINNTRFHYGMLISHDYFVELRAEGITRWKPLREIIKWD